MTLVVESFLNRSVPVLDHGFVRVVDVMGDDTAIVTAARVSYKRARRMRKDAALLRYLLRKRHTSPFEQCEIKLHVKVPLFVARQWVRHRTASMNEISGRYGVLKDEFYIPTEDRVREQSATNKQGSGEKMTAEYAQEWCKDARDVSEYNFKFYQDSCEDGVARELSRIILPLNTYTEFYWKIDLHNLMHFLSLRLDSHAQWEIRQYAQVIADFVRIWVPDTWAAFEDYRLGAVTLSATVFKALKRILGPLETLHVPLDSALRLLGVGERERGEVLGHFMRGDGDEEDGAEV